jgi:radical SAM protein with 4Fe4S-binding SPASM domain
MRALDLMRSLTLLDAPRVVQWVVSHQCNFQCAHCMVRAGKPVQNELSTSEAKVMIDQLAHIGVRVLSLTGGEPFVRPDIFDLIKYAKEKRLKVGVATNGWLVRHFENQLREVNIDSVMVSVDGNEKENDELRVPGSYQRALDAILFFKEIGTRTLSISTTFHKNNIDTLEDMGELVRSLSVEWSVKTVLPQGRAKDNRLCLTSAEAERFFEYMSKNHDRLKIHMCSEMGYLGKYQKELRGAKRFVCGCGYDSCAIMANGDVMACPLFEIDTYVAGNLREMSFQDIWYKGFKKFRDYSWPESCQACELFKACKGGCKVSRILGADCHKNVWR